MLRPRIAITMGDPAGIGPELIAKTLTRHTDLPADLVFVGAPECLENAALALGERLELSEWKPGEPLSGPAFVRAGVAGESIVPGVLSAAAGQLAYDAIATAVDLALAGHVSAIVTAPINKEAVQLAGHRFPGHTEILATLTGSPDSCMLLVHDRLRVAHVSTHTALANVPERLTPERLRRVIELTQDALLRLGIAAPRIAVAALNPHAGEGGMFGDEDDRVSRPVIEQLCQEGLDVAGPIPGDTVFVKAVAGQYDAVIAMYHDQGHIPIKLLGFSIDEATGTWNAVSGVNVTLGLPIIRTSVDHGTAFDIAGRGIASEDSLVEAIELAIGLAARVPSPVR